MTLEIPDLLVERLKARASTNGTTMEDYLISLLNSTSESVIEARNDLDYDEWRLRLDQFQRNTRSDLPLLTEEALSRAAIYEGR